MSRREIWLTRPAKGYTAHQRKFAASLLRRAVRIAVSNGEPRLCQQVLWRLVVAASHKGRSSVAAKIRG